MHRIDFEQYPSVRQVAKRRLMTLAAAADYIWRRHGILVEPDTLREAVCVGDLRAWVPTRGRSHPKDLDRCALRFTKIDIERSEWMFMEQLIRGKPPRERERLVRMLRHPASIPSDSIQRH